MNDNIYKLFLNFLKFENYPIDDSEDTKNKLFKLNNYSCWLEHYIQIQVYNLKYIKRDNDEDTINYWHDTVNNIIKWDIKYEDENVFYSNGCKYERIKPESTQRSQCIYCSCMSLGDDFPCNVMSCENDYAFKLIPLKMNKEKENLIRFFENFLKNYSSTVDYNLTSFIDKFNVENVDQWMKIFNGTQNTSSYSDNENNWKLCAEYIKQHNMILLENSNLIIDGKEYCQIDAERNECLDCIFEHNDFTELCCCIPCKGIIYKEYNSLNGRKFDSDKLRYDLIPPVIDEELAKILTYGAKKYGENNWQSLENFNNRYYAALRRHIEAWRNGEDIDEESGEHHLSHALTNIAFLVWNNVNKKL